MAEIKNTKSCTRCKFFTAYYEKGYCCYLRTDCGYCSEKENLTKKSNYCDKWQAKIYKYTAKQRAVIHGLANVLSDIKMLRDYIEDSSIK